MRHPRDELIGGLRFEAGKKRPWFSLYMKEACKEYLLLLSILV